MSVADHGTATPIFTHGGYAPYSWDFEDVQVRLVPNGVFQRTINGELLLLLADLGDGVTTPRSLHEISATAHMFITQEGLLELGAQFLYENVTYTLKEITFVGIKRTPSTDGWFDMRSYHIEGEETTPTGKGSYEDRLTSGYTPSE